MKAPSHIPLAKRNSVVFSLLWNGPSVVDNERRIGGRTCGPETAKLLETDKRLCKVYDHILLVL